MKTNNNNNSHDSVEHALYILLSHIIAYLMRSLHERMKRGEKDSSGYRDSQTKNGDGA